MILVMPDNRLSFQMKDGTSIDYHWKTSRSDSWTPEMKEQARLRALKQHKGGVNNG
jgi:hypothetical protein